MKKLKVRYKSGEYKTLYMGDGANEYRDGKNWLEGSKSESDGMLAQYRQNLRDIGLDNINY